ncbi:MAG: hypothetical protein AAF433_19140 [Bacteroidota bacterium]
MFKPNPSPQLLFLAIPERVAQLRDILLQATFSASVISTDALVWESSSIPQPDLLVLQLDPQAQAALWQKIQTYFAGTPQMIWPPEAPLCLQQLNALLGLAQAEQQPLTKQPPIASELRQQLQGLRQAKLDFLRHTQPAPYQIRLQFFGRLKLASERNTGNVRLARKARKALVYLLLNRRRIHKENLARLFWVYGGKSALNSLHQSAYLIRKALDQDFGLQDILRYEDDCYFINPQYQIVSDWQELQTACLQAEAVAENSQEQLQHWLYAYQLQQGNFLESLANEEDFLTPIREKSEELRKRVKRALVRYSLQYDLPGMASLIQESA